MLIPFYVINLSTSVYSIELWSMIKVLDSTHSKYDIDDEDSEDI